MFSMNGLGAAGLEVVKIFHKSEVGSGFMKV